MEANKHKPEPGDGRGVERGGSRVSRGWQVPLPFHGPAARGSGASRLPRALLRCSPLFPRQSLVPQHGRQGGPGGAVLLLARFECTLTHTCARPRASRAFHGQPDRDHPVLPSLCHPPG